MIFMIFFLGIKSFNYLNIFDGYSPIVSMFFQVGLDLKEFLLIFFVCLVSFSLMLTPLQNLETENYHFLGDFWGNIIDVLKMSLGDFSVISRVQDDLKHIALFWISWLSIVLIMAIIVMNFIIAQATISHTRI